MDEDGILTALPGSTDPDTGRLRVTAFVTPRLDAGGGRRPLSDYPGFADWGATAAGTALALEVESAGFTGVLALEPDPASPRPEPTLWHALFDRVVVGDGHFQDLSGQTVASFPSAAVSELVRTLYATVAETSPTATPPATSGPLTVLHPLGRLLRSGRGDPSGTGPTGFLPSASPAPGSPASAPGRYVDRSALAPPTSPVGSVQTVQEAMRFYDRPGSKDPLGPDVVPDPPERPDLELHGFVAALADYPELLRHLGLALDFLVLDDGRIPQGTGRLRFRPEDVSVDWPRREATRPWTRFERRDRRFVALPRDREGELVDGSLRVESPRHFHLEQIDLDGAALKLAATARTVVATSEVVEASPGSDSVAPSMTPDAESLPALRGSGLTLYRDRRAESVVTGWDAAAQQASALGSGTVVDLWGEDVTRGLRLDVAEEGAPEVWFSLHARAGDYLLRTDVPGDRRPLPLPSPPGPDEGYLKRATASHNGAEPDVAYVHEAVAGWEGWSLAAPRPGNRIGLLGVEDPVDPADEPEPFPMPLVVGFRPVRGSLPRLRFGRSYRVRARLVDMAGRSVPAEQLAPEHATAFTTFFRWDPVPSPAVVPRRPFTEGESLLRLVIRSTLDVHSDDYVTLPRIVALAGHTRDDLAYRAVDERHLAAPTGSQQLAELHGCFDDAVHQGSTAAQRDAQFAVGALSAGTFSSAADAGAVTDGKAPPRPVELPLDEHGQVVPHANLQGPGEYVLHDVDELSLPYLPDPLALGVSFTSLPGDDSSRVLKWPGDGRWYDRRPVRLRVQEGAGEPVWDADQRVLTVLLPQAEHAVVHLSSALPKDQLPLMGVWMLERETVRDAQLDDAVLGRHWMLTPWTRLELVHAVEKPLTPPVIQVADPPVYDSAVHRFPGDTFASLNGTIAVHARSTGRLDVEAQWTEPVDDVTRPGPEQHAGQAHVGDFLLDATEDACRIGRDELAPTPGRPATHLLRHELGDTRHRWIGYTATATTRFREYFPTEITDRSLGGDLTVHTGPTLRLDVPSSRHPDPPQVEYVVPTWRWEERTVLGARPAAGWLQRWGDLATTTVHRRVGGGLRVYLGRPWYSSGDDELLGVVVRQQPWFPLPEDAGLTVSAAVHAQADLAADQLLTTGQARGGGRARSSATERLLTGLASARAPRAPSVSARTTAQTGQLTAHLAALEGVGEPDEQVAALARTTALSRLLDGAEGLLGAAGPLVTSWGTDPVWASAPTDRGPYVHQFALRTAVGTGVALPGQVERAVVVGHTPVFDEDRGLWACDLQIDAGAAYQPFVDLALVRYQPHSIADRDASAVVRPGFSQLLPDRTAALTRLHDGALAVSLRGPAGYNELGSAFMAGASAAALVDASYDVTAQLQSRPAAADDLDWEAVGQPTRLHAAGSSLADMQWHATVPAPAELPTGTELRLLVTEHELHSTDESVAETHVTRPVGGFGRFARLPANRRLVFATDFTL